MKKMRLTMETLKVDSFPTTAQVANQRGSVHAREPNEPSETCVLSCWPSCEPQETCPYTCAEYCTEDSYFVCDSYENTCGCTLDCTVDCYSAYRPCTG
jgi:hypothetical protein